MKELLPADDLLILLSEFNVAGGAIDYVLIDPEARIENINELHREAAIFGLRAIGSRWESQGPEFDPCFTFKFGPLGIRLRNLFGFRKPTKPALRTSDYFWP